MSSHCRNSEYLMSSFPASALAAVRQAAGAFASKIQGHEGKCPSEIREKLLWLTLSYSFLTLSPVGGSGLKVQLATNQGQQPCSPAPPSSQQLCCFFYMTEPADKKSVSEGEEIKLVVPPGLKEHS